MFDDRGLMTRILFLPGFGIGQKISIGQALMWLIAIFSSTSQQQSKG